MPRGRSPSKSPVSSSRRRPSRALPSRVRKARSSSSGTPDSPSRRPGLPRRRSPPRRPRSPVRPRRPRVKKSSGSSSSGSESRHRSSSSGSSDSSSRSSSSSSSDTGSSTKPTPAKRSPPKRSPRRSPLKRSPRRSPPKRSPRRSPVERVAKAKDASPRRIDRNERLPLKRLSPLRRSPPKERKPEERPQAERQIERSSKQSPPVSRFHSRKSYSRSRSPLVDRKSPRRIEVRREKEDKPSRVQRGDGTLIHVSNITRNVRQSHLQEIFEIYGKIVEIDLPMMTDFNFPRGYARIRYEKSSEAKAAKEHMSGGQIDGQLVSVEVIQSTERHSPPPPEKKRRGDSNERDTRIRRPRSRSSSSGRDRSRSSSSAPPLKRR
ncbi:RNA-binding protein with serine-rich domain 1 [Thelohanellus kitauei]|uniref:RNA-binding protein with serine-rich domain 1 n=1 Tax=Thelohanellus kitauei TaxID=669202 RepID=A0A0C2M2Z5_THEKT|nr:RNA-binding protein with serine-rich domain 1 [Thelohanellus kitauei]